MRRLKLKSNLKSTKSTKSTRTRSKKKVSFSSHLVFKPYIDLPSHYSMKKNKKK